MNKIKKLIPCEDFVIGLNNIGYEVQSISHQNSNRANRFRISVNYSTLFKQELILGMFIPCDKEGNVLEKPKPFTDKNDGSDHFSNHAVQWKVYKEAEERILFKGFETLVSVQNIRFFLDGILIDRYNLKYNCFEFNSIISELTEHNLELTDNALKQIYGN